MARARVDNIKNFFTWWSDKKQQNISEPQTTQVTWWTAWQWAWKISIERYTPHKTQNVIKKAVPNIDVSLDEQVPTNTNNNINWIDISSSWLWNLWVKTNSWTNVSTWIDISAWATTWINSWLASPDILSWVTLKDNWAEKKEQEITDDKLWLENTYNSIKSFFSEWRNTLKWLSEDLWVSHVIETNKQYSVKWVYDSPTSYGTKIFYIDFNDEGKWVTKDWSEREFIEKYNQARSIMNDNTWTYSEEDKKTAVEDFYNDIIPLLKVENASYIKWAFNSTTASNLYLWYNTDDNKNKYNEAWWQFEVTKEDAIDFVNKFEANNEMAMTLSNREWEQTDMSFSYAFSDESREQVLSNMINNSSSNYTTTLSSYVDDEKLTWIASQSFTSRADSFIQTQNNRALMYLETPLAEYYKVREKLNNWEELSYWEKRVLKAWPYLEWLVNDYSKYIWDVVDETVKQWYTDWEITFNIKSMDWLSMQKYWVSSVYMNYKNAMDALWVDSRVLWYYSALDLLQLVWNATSDNYWDWKWWDIYSWWKLLQSTLGRVWFDFWEWMSYAYRQTLQWWIFWTQYSDATASDFASITLLDTWKEWLWRTMKEYYSSFNENIPEIAWTLLSDRVFPENKTLKLTPRVNSMLKVWSAASKAWDVVEDVATAPKFRTWSRFEKFWKFSWKQQTTKAIKDWVNWISEANKASWLSNTSQWVKNFLRNSIDRIFWTSWSNERKLRWLLAKDIVSNTIADQRLDALMSYYDTEAYSPASFWISVWMSMITEVLSPLLHSALLWNTLSRVDTINWWFLNAFTWDWWSTWSFIRYVDWDDWTMKRFSEISKLLEANWSPMTLKHLHNLSWNWEQLLWDMDSLLKELWVQWANAMWKFSKDTLFDKIRWRQDLDKSSEFYKRLTNLVNSEQTNVADVVKYILWISWEVEVWPFKSIIKFKDWDSIQSRYLINWKWWSKYDLYLDRIDWQFINQLRNWFDEKSIREISKIEWYDWVLKDWDINSNMFEYDKKTKKYYINQNWADKFWLNISDYTDALKKADAIEAVAKNDGKIVMKMLKKLSDKSWIWLDTLWELTSWGTFSQIRWVLEEIMC